MKFLRHFVVIAAAALFFACPFAIAASNAFEYVAKNDWIAARAASIEAKDPLGSRVFYWLVCTQKSAHIVWQPKDFGNLSSFIKQSAGWPRMSEIVLMAEKAMPDTLSSQQMIAWFDEYPPRTSAGMNRYVEALLETGDEARAKAVLRAWWASALLKPQDQKAIYSHYGKWLDENAHVARLDSLLLAGYSKSAMALAKWMGGGYPALANARISLAKNKSNASSAVAMVPKSLLSDAGLSYERLRWRRRHDLDAGAIEILANPPPSDKISNPSDWWKERHIMIRRLTEKGDYKTAYGLASEHGQSRGMSFAQGEFLAGWLALRFLGKPAIAFEHFEHLYYGVSTPVSRARAAYWAGRAARDMGNDKIAQAWFKSASDVPMRFYGQLAAAELASDAGRKMPSFSSPKVSMEDAARFSADDRIKAAKMLHSAGLNKSAGEFLHAFARTHASASAYSYAASLASKMGLSYEAIAITKKAERQGLAIGAKAWPVLKSSQARRSSKYVDKTLLHAIIRQESAFNPRARSPSGALGLMQVMPATAKETAHKSGIRYSKRALGSDGGYNISIGSRHMAGLLKKYDGNVPLAVAAYNAGSARVDGWIKTFGDPRSGAINTIDWIELIPVYETRNYVQRVLENRYVYRTRLK